MSNMSDLISIQAAIDAAKDLLELITFDIERLLSTQPEHKTGQWIEDGYYNLPCVCSRCGKEGNRSYKFCPNCGAEMRGEQE